MSQGGSYIKLDIDLPDGSKKYFETTCKKEFSLTSKKGRIVIRVDGKVREILPLGTQFNFAERRELNPTAPR